MIEKRSYGFTHDYVVTFNEYCDSSFPIEKLQENRWISVRISKKLTQSRFTDLLKGYSRCPYIADKRYLLYFNEPSLLGMPKIDKNSRLHLHVNVKIIIGEHLLKIKPQHGRNWYNVSGGVEVNEEPLAAAKREIYEELNITIDNLVFVKTKKTFIKIPILDRAIETIMYYYEGSLPSMPELVVCKKEISQVKLGNTIIVCPTK